MYRLQIEFYATEPQNRVNAVFEQDEHGKTQRLASKGLWITPDGSVREASHAEILGFLCGMVPLFAELLSARLDSPLPGIADTL